MKITSLKPNQIFVFGSNTEGRHGRGAALQAMNFGAIAGNPGGRQGQSYAIVTKDLSKGDRSIRIADIEAQVCEFLMHASERPEEEFLVTAIGCGLAGYTVDEMAPLWMQGWQMPNVILPDEFLDWIRQRAIEDCIYWINAAMKLSDRDEQISGMSSTFQMLEVMPVEVKQGVWRELGEDGRSWVAQMRQEVKRWERLCATTSA